MCHTEFPFKITCYPPDTDTMKANFEYLQARANTLVTVHSRETVADILQMLTRNRILHKDKGIFVVINNEELFLV